MNDLKYHNTTALQKLGNFIGDTLGKSSEEVHTLTALANQPVTISPLVYIIPAVAVGIFGIIYFTVIRK
jgi:hypothetical protein